MWLLRLAFEPWQRTGVYLDGELDRKPPFLVYRHVIATMWSIADSPAPQVADAVYATLSRNGTPEAEQSARAVHQAVRYLRQQEPTNPLFWGPYTHIGA